MTDSAFFAPSRRFRVGEIATLTGAELKDPRTADVEITRLAPVHEAGAETLAFIEGARGAAMLGAVKAAAVLCKPDLAGKLPEGVAVLISGRPQQAFVQFAGVLFPSSARLAPITGQAGISELAHVAADAQVEAGAVIEAGAHVASGASIGRGSIVGPGVVVGPSCRVGRDCFLGHGVTIQCALIGDRVVLHPGVRVGQDGFGYIPGRAGLAKVPQLGRVVIQDDVEIGANSTIDRGALSDTVIGEGTKIDNLVQIAHNVRIGRMCVIAGLCGLSGSVTLGDGVMLGGGVGLADHITIGSGVQIAGRSGVMNDIPAGERWGGTPAKPYREALRELAAIRGLLKKGRDTQ